MSKMFLQNFLEGRIKSRISFDYSTGKTILKLQAVHQQEVGCISPKVDSLFNSQLMYSWWKADKDNFSRCWRLLHLVKEMTPLPSLEDFTSPAPEVSITGIDK